LFVNPAFLTCLSGTSKNAPSVTVTLKEGKLNDSLTVKLKHFKANLAFGLFSVANSDLNSDGTVNSSFVNFGLAWYQSDLTLNGSGSGSAQYIRFWRTRSSVSIQADC
jgi:hypothetical protein